MTATSPLFLETRQHIDLSHPASCASSLQLLQASIRERQDVVAARDMRPACINAPPLPNNFVDRPEIMTAGRPSHRSGPTLPGAFLEIEE